MASLSRLLGTAGLLVLPAAAGVAQAPAVTPADLAFVRGMIAHHRQALEMSALITERTRRESLRLLGERITVSQQDEIAMMEGWLRRYGPPGASGSDSVAHPPAHAHEGAAMPGMLTPAEMARLAASFGDDFDRRFLAGMIAHHRGALVMVAELLKVPGSARQPQLHQMVVDVDADQRAEIARMEALLATIPAPPAGRP